MNTQTIRTLFFALVTVITMGAAVGMAQATEDGYRLGTGDMVKVIVYGQEDLSGEFQVDGQGYISFPLIEELEVANLTIRELEQLIHDKLSPDYLKSPRVSAEVVNFRPFYILGEVKNPGRYDYVNGMNVVTAIALAGGYTYRAKKSAVEIERAGQTTAADNTTAVRPGDVITVPERFW